MVICIYSAYVHICTYRPGIKINHRVAGLLHLQANKKKYLFPEMRWQVKSSPRWLQIYFFNALCIFQIYYLFFFTFFGFHLYSCFFMFACLFFENKNIFWYTFHCVGGWMMKDFSPSRFLKSEQKQTGGGVGS